MPTLTNTNDVFLSGRWGGTAPAAAPTVTMRHGGMQYNAGVTFRF